MNKKENIKKYYKDYANRLVISDASPLIYLSKVGKLEYLKLLFTEVYTTETVKKECKRIHLPDWIKVEEPSQNIKNAINRKGIDAGERSAIGLALEIDAREKYNIAGGKICLILDDKEARHELKRLNLSIENIGLKEILSFAIDKNICNKTEMSDILKNLDKHGRKFKNKDIQYILGNSKSNGVKI